LLSNYDLEIGLREFKKNITRNITIKFNEYANYLQSKNPGRNEWIYEIFAADVEITKNDCLQLCPVDISNLPIRKNNAKVLESPIKFKSGYAENLRNLIQLNLQTAKSKVNPENKQKWNLSHLDLLRTLVSQADLENMEAYGYDLSVSRVENTYFQTLNYTLEPSNTFFAKKQIHNVDYIFFNGNIDVLSSLNTPDIYTMLETKGLPNKDYPSDHINISVDFVINL
jgi:hypothetical protein